VPSVGHLAVALAVARVQGPPSRVRMWTWTLLLVALSFLPDVDVVGFALGIPYGAPMGHRGAAHSIAFALLLAGLVGMAAAWGRLPPLALSLTAAVVVASHGLLDALTDGGRGVALLWPFTADRYFAPWRPIPVAPIGPRIFSRAGLSLMAYEALLFTPLWLLAVWPRRRGGGRPPQ
jgi:inner membrane protein